MKKSLFCMIVVSLFVCLQYLFSEDIFLGTINTNKYDPNSVNNPYGKYGSKYSQQSINNPYGQYGSKYSNDSPNNPYATNAPIIVNEDGKYMGKMNSNKYDPDSISNPYGKYGSKYSPDSINNPYGAGNPYKTKKIHLFSDDSE